MARKSKLSRHVAATRAIVQAMKAGQPMGARALAQATGKLVSEAGGVSNADYDLQNVKWVIEVLGEFGAIKVNTPQDVTITPQK